MTLQGRNAFARTDIPHFDAFVKGRTAINNNDYPTRDICICIIRRLVSRVILQKTLHYLDKCISTVTQVGVINNPSPNRIHALSEAMGFLYASTFTHRDFNYLTIYDREYNPYVTTELLISAKVLKTTGFGLSSKYSLDTSTWDLLGKEGIDTLKTLRLIVSAGLLENDPALYLDVVTNKWVKTPLTDVKYTFFTAESLNNAGKLSTFSIPLPFYPPADTFYGSNNYVETISAFAVPTNLVTNAHHPELMTNEIGSMSLSFEQIGGTGGEFVGGMKLPTQAIALKIGTPIYPNPTVPWLTHGHTWDFLE